MPVQTRSATHGIDRAKETGRIIIEVRFRCEKTCAICRCDMYGDKVYHLPCGHTFHTECFKNQLQNMRHNPHKCACCRYNVLDALKLNDTLYNLLPNPHLLEEGFQRDMDDFLELVAIYSFIHRPVFDNAIIVNRPLINIPPPPPPEPFPLLQEQPTMQVENDNESTTSNHSNNSNNSNNSLDSEDLFFNNSRMFHRNIHRRFPQADPSSNNITIQRNVHRGFEDEPFYTYDYSFNVYPGATDSSNNNEVETLDPINVTYNTIQIPYGNYENDDYESNYDALTDTDSMPELISDDSDLMPEEAADPYELDMFMSDNIDYPSTPPENSSETDTRTETDSDSETHTISL